MEEEKSFSIEEEEGNGYISVQSMDPDECVSLMPFVKWKSGILKVIPPIKEGVCPITRVEDVRRILNKHGYTEDE